MSAARLGSARASAALETHDTPLDLRLAPAALLAWAGTFWATGASVLPAALLTSGTAGLTLALALRWRGPTTEPICETAGEATVPPRRRRVSTIRPHLILALAALALAVTGATAQMVVRGAGDYQRWVGERAVVEATGTISADPHRVAALPNRPAGAPRYSVSMTLSRLDARGQRIRVDVPVLVIGDGAWATARVGARVALIGRLAPPEPGQRITALVIVTQPPRLIAEPAVWWRIAEHIRAGLREAVRDRPADSGGLLPSLVLGDTSTLTEQTREQLGTAGLAHLTAVSGANVAIVTGAALWVATAAGLLRRGRLLVAATGLIGFVIMARPEPSVVRAAAMAVVMLVGLLATRPGRGIPALAGSVLVLLLVDPWLSRSIGFALSVAATGALLILAPPWARRLQRFFPRPVALALAAPAAAQAVCGPIIVLIDPRVSLVAVPANLLADPAVMPATVLGVLAAILSQVWPGGAELVAAAGCWGTWWITEVARVASSLPHAAIGWPGGLSGAIGLGLLTLAVVVLSLTRLRLHAVLAVRSVIGSVPGERSPPRPRRVPAVILVLLVLGGAGWWLGGVLGDRGGAATARNWALAECDVGQGDATVIRSGPAAAVVVDAGPEPEPVGRCLDELRVRTVDLLVLSHFHADHVGGLDGVLSGRRVLRVLVSPLAAPRSNAAAVTAALARHGLSPQPVTQALSGRGGSGGWQMSWRIPVPYLPGGDTTTGGEGEDGSANDASLVLDVEQITPDGARLRTVALGDLEDAGQRHLLRSLSDAVATGGDAGLPGDPPGAGVDVVKVAHHGSAKQDRDLYGLLAPRLALIGVGRDNDYGHPQPAALTMLTQLGVHIARTDQDGTITVSATGEDVAARPRSPARRADLLVSRAG